MKNPKVQFVIRGLRLREMESNFKRKEEEVRKLTDKLIERKDRYQKQRELVIEKVNKIKKLKQKIESQKTLTNHKKEEQILETFGREKKMDSSRG